MGLFDHFPYTNVHELNLDWVLSMMKALEAEWESFTAGNSLTFADPLQHDISKTYAKNTIVLSASGDAYVSLQAVPLGVALSDQDYWLMVFDYEAFIEKVNKNFTARYYRGQYRATSAIDIGDWLTVDDILYKATAAIAEDGVIEVGVNVTHFTLEDFIKAFIQSATQLINQYKDDIDASELAYRQQLAQDIANTTQSLQAQLDAAITGVTVDSEVINARVGADGTIYPTLGDAIRTQVITRLNDLGNFTRASFITKFTTCDNVTQDTILRIIASGGQTTIPGAPSNSYCTLITTGGGATNGAQCFIENVSPYRVFTRVQSTSGGVPYWGDWHRINLDETALKDLGTTSVTDFVTNYTSFDNMPAETVIRLVTYSGTNTIPGAPSNTLGTLITLGGSYKCQYYIENKGPGNMYSRYQRTSSGVLIWEDWRPVIEDEYIIDKNATGEDAHTSLLDGLLYCYNNGVNRVRVKPGTYNMIDEYEATYGVTWDTDVDDSKGIPLRNISIIFEAGAKVTFNYTGGRSNIHRNMSLFYTTDSDCYVEGLDLECGNIRYGIHDECGGTTSAYSHIFKECNIEKTDNNSDWTASYAIGGGLGMYGRVEIDGGRYKCENQAESVQNDTIYYHNNAALTGTASKVYIHGIYCWGPVGSVHSGGQIQTDGSKADMYVYACRFNRAPRQSSAETFNFYAWSNTIET